MKKRQLDKIAWIDVESTGVDTSKDRIIQIAVFLTDINLNKISPTISSLINPEIPIPLDSTKVNGITDEMVSKAPKWSEAGPGVFAFIKNAHIGGYNVRFDIQMLIEEFNRIDITWGVDDLMIVDPYPAVVKKHPRDQSSIYLYYTGGVLADAHDAKADIEATLAIAKAQIERYEDINSIEDLYNMSDPQDQCDLAGKIKMKDGIPVFNLGKHFGKPISEEIGFLNWMLKQDFPTETKKWIENYLENIKNE